MWPFFEPLFTKILNVIIAECSIQRCLQDMPYEILYQIFRRLPKGRLIEISRLCLKFRGIAGDRRLWKDVYIKYGSMEKPTWVTFAFEELYSEPWPVKVIDLRYTTINTPVSSQTDQIVKTTKLFLSSITANKVTIDAILNKYQCTELHFRSDCKVLEIKPETFLKRTSLEVLSLEGILSERDYHHWLVPVMNYCKNLKTLSLRYTYLGHLDMLRFVQKLPTSLDKLFLGPAYLEDSFFELLAGSIPNLRELGISFEMSPLPSNCPLLTKFRLLEILHIVIWEQDINISDFYMYLEKFPALKTVYIIVNSATSTNSHAKDLEELQRTLEPHVRLIEGAKKESFVNNNLWEVSKTI